MSSIKLCFSKIFSNDIFNHHFYLRIGREKKNSTLFSIIISQFFLIGFLGYLAYSSIDMFKRTNPTINIQSFDINNRPFINLNSHNFHFAIKLEYNDGSTIPLENIENIFEINATFYSQNQKQRIWGDYKTKRFSFEPCKIEDFTSFEDYYKTNLDKAFCLKDHDFDIGGFWDEKKLNYFYLTIDFCKKNSQNNCKKKNEILELLKGAYLTFYIESQNVDANDYNSPMKKSFKYYSYLIDPNIKKNLNFYIQQVELKSYDNLLFLDLYKSENYFKQNLMNLEFNSNNSDENLNAFWEIYLYSSNQIQIVERKYVSLLQVLSSIGGLIKFLMIFGTFFTLYYNEMKLNSLLLNELFIFDMETIPKSQSSKQIKLNFRQSLNFRESLFISEENLKNNQNYNKNYQSSTHQLNFSSPQLSPLMENSENKDLKMKRYFSLGKKRLSLDITKQKQLEILQTEIEEKKSEKQIIEFSEVDEQENEGDYQKDDKKNRNSLEFPNSQISGILKKNNLSSKNLRSQESKKKINFTEESLKKHDLKDQIDNKSHLDFSFWEIMRSIFFPIFLSKTLKNKLKLYQKSSEDLLKYINIIELVQKLQQLEKLKMILFNKNQLLLFNYISKPLVSSKMEVLEEMTSKKKITDMMRFLESDNRTEQLNDIINYYNELKTTGNYSEIDKRLFELLDDDLIDTIGGLQKEKKK